ncbi:MAG: DegT/DnrJ/EryC1/StrS family aminotransferase [Sphaerospermopsis kisseleviana]
MPSRQCKIPTLVRTGDWDLKEIVEFAQKHDLWLIEDNCDALGSLYQGKLAS